MSDHGLDRNIKITPDGPYLVTGGIPLQEETIIANAHGRSVRWEAGHRYKVAEQYALCRCGESGNSPFCDGSHRQTRFNGTETASREPYLEQAQLIEGPTLILTDVVPLCAYVRFCHRPEGSVWELTEQSDDPELRESAIAGAANCAAGRLITWDRESRQSIEPHYEPSIGVVEDPPQGVSGPLWVRGGIPVVGEDGQAYEKREQLALCRCGQSDNKPFCDASHVQVGFRARSTRD